MQRTRSWHDGQERGFRGQVGRRPLGIQRNAGKAAAPPVAWAIMKATACHPCSRIQCSCSSGRRREMPTRNGILLRPQSCGVPVRGHGAVLWALDFARACAATSQVTWPRRCDTRRPLDLWPCRGAVGGGLRRTFPEVVPASEHAARATCRIRSTRPRAPTHDMTTYAGRSVGTVLSRLSGSRLLDVNWVEKRQTAREAYRPPCHARSGFQYEGSEDYEVSLCSVRSFSETRNRSRFS